MKDNELLWKREWGAPLFCSHGANNSRGVAILVRNNFNNCSVEEIVRRRCSLYYAQSSVKR